MLTRVLRTYMALRNQGDLRGIPNDARTMASTAPSPARSVELREVPEVDTIAYRALYEAVGREFNWLDRLAWSDTRLASHLGDPAVTVWQLTLDRVVAGYFELHRHGPVLPGTAQAFVDTDSPNTDSRSSPPAAVPPTSAAPCELVYFGLVGSAQGRGLGRWLLERAIDEAWNGGSDLLWLHTCSLDHPAAIPNYRGRGFRPFATFLYEEEVPERQPQ